MHKNRKSIGPAFHDDLTGTIGDVADKSRKGLPQLLTIPEVAELLKISVVGVRRLQIGRLIPFIKVGGSVRFAATDILSYLEKQRIDAIG